MEQRLISNMSMAIIRTPPESRKITLQFHPSASFVFQRRTERLDWRRIASLDIEKLVGEGDLPSLEEFIRPILFCKADLEFSDSSASDQGFLKVFRLSQLIGEWLISVKERDEDKLREMGLKCTELELNNGKLQEELLLNKESIQNLRKDLKKTKELLAQTQSQVLGNENHDEIDQCPYCTKKFLSPFYLHAHIQRRHQGLPLPPQYQYFNYSPSSTTMLPFQPMPSATPTTVYAFTTPNNIPPNVNLPQQSHGPPPQNLNSETDFTLVQRRDSETQTAISSDRGDLGLSVRVVASRPSEGEFSEIQHEAQAHNDPVVPIPASLDMNVIFQLVEQYLEQKTTSEPAHTSHETDGNTDGAGISSQIRDPPGVSKHHHEEMSMNLMKEQFEAQWAQLSEKVADSGITELKTSFLSEIKKVQEMIRNSESQSNTANSVKDVEEGEKSQKIPVNDSVSVDDAIGNTGDVKIPTDKENPKPSAPAPLPLVVVEELKFEEKQKESVQQHSQQQIDTIKFREELESLRIQLLHQEESWKERLQSLETDHEAKLIKFQNEIQSDRNREKVEHVSQKSHDIPKSQSHHDQNRHPLSQSNAEVYDSKHDDDDLLPSPLPIAKPRRHTKTVSSKEKDYSTSITKKYMSVPIDESEDDENYLTIVKSQGGGGNNGSERRSVNKTTKFSTWMSNEGKVGKSNQEYEEPGHVQRFDVTEYTLSDSAVGDRDEEEESDREENLRNLRKWGSTSKVVFDAKKGRLIDARETKSQLDLVRDRVVLDEMDRKLQKLGLDPQANALSLDEMSRALKHLKAERLGDGADLSPDKFMAEKKSVNKEVNYEVAKRSIHQKLDKYDVLSKRSHNSPLLSILSKVKKSGSSWKKKMASAMKKKGSPNKSSKGLTSNPNVPDTKRTFFSRWGKNKGKNPKKNEDDQRKPKKYKSDSEDQSDSNEESSVDVELPPFMTKSRPVLRPHDDEITSDEEIPLERKESKNKSQSRTPMKSKVIEELKEKMGPNNKEGYKGPSFLVKGSPNSKHQKDEVTASRGVVTSSGWVTIGGDTNRIPTPPPKAKPRVKRDLLSEFQESEDLDDRNRVSKSVPAPAPHSSSESDDVPPRQKHLGNHSIATTKVPNTGNEKKSFARWEESRRGFRRGSRKSTHTTTASSTGSESEDTEDEEVDKIRQRQFSGSKSKIIESQETLGGHHHRHAGAGQQQQHKQKNPPAQPQRHQQQQPSRSRDSSPTLRSSDTSVWETESEDSDDDDIKKGRKVALKRSKGQLLLDSGSIGRGPIKSQLKPYQDQRRERDDGRHCPKPLEKGAKAKANNHYSESESESDYTDDVLEVKVVQERINLSRFNNQNNSSQLLQPSTSKMTTNVTKPLRRKDSISNSWDD